jgi:hypothetical protein
MRTATTSAQFGNGVPAIDVFRLNHSMIAFPRTACGELTLLVLAGFHCVTQGHLRGVARHMASRKGPRTGHAIGFCLCLHSPSSSLICGSPGASSAFSPHSGHITNSSAIGAPISSVPRCFPTSRSMPTEGLKHDLRGADVRPFWEGRQRRASSRSLSLARPAIGQIRASERFVSPAGPGID